MEPVSLARRFQMSLRYKLGMALLLNLVVAVPYFALQHVRLFPVTSMPEWGIDQSIAFAPASAWIYLSLFVLLALGPAFMVQTHDLRHYATGITVLALVSNGIFLLFPTTISRPLLVSDDPAYRVILATDGPLNACPSLHASLALFAALACDRLLGASGVRKAWRLLLWLWTAAILISTLTTKQHVLLDLLAGGVLTLTVDAYLHRRNRMPRETAASSPTSGGLRPPLATSEARTYVSAGIETALDALHALNLPKRLVEIACFLGLWVGGAALTLTFGLAGDDLLSWLAYAAGLFLSAVAINSFVLFLHEGMHHTLFANPRANRWASVLFGSTVLMSFTAYQVMHLRHHTYLGDPRDPDDYHNQTQQRLVLWVLHFLRLFLGAFLYVILIPRLAWRHGSPLHRRRLVEEYLFLACLYVAIAFIAPGWVVLHGWFLPALLAGFMVNIRGLTQHGITDAQDPFLASRSIEPHPLVAFCLLYENYHLEHHFFPEVPSYHLPAIRRLIEPRLPRAVTGTSYLGFLVCFLKACWTMDESPIGLRGEERPEMAVPPGATRPGRRPPLGRRC